MNKKGAISLSFGFIFSIIIIIAIIGTAFYVINYFLDLSKCTTEGVFLNDFQEAVNDAWASEITRDVFIGNLPGGIKAVCIGDLNQAGSEERELLQRYSRFNANLYFYPPNKACDVPYKKIERIDFSEVGFECFSSENGRVRIPLEKGSFDSLVKIGGE